MKKTWVALAVAGMFAGAAHAQSSVTLYGILDVNYMWQELPTNVGTSAAPRIQQESVSAINGGHQAGNRWGLRGSEDLGGGMSAIFTLESGFDIDRGTLGQGGRLFGRQAWVGVQGGWGALVAGRLATFSSGTGSFDMFGRTDPFATGFGLASLGNTFISANALRVDNAIAYRTPKMGGFQGALGYTTRIDGAETAPNNTNVKAFISALTFETGPFWASVTYDAVDNIGNNPDQKHLQIGATYDIGQFRLHAGYADQSNIGALPSLQGGAGAFLNLPAGIAPFDATAYMGGVTWKLGAWQFMGSYQWFNAKGSSGRNPATGATVVFDPDYTVWGIGTTYSLSRRTNLYASYASRDADGTLSGNAFDAQQFAVGLLHRF